MNWDSLIRRAVQRLTPYSSARYLQSSQRNEFLFLDANEASDEDLIWNRYPEPKPRNLLKSLSEFYKVPEECLFIGRGSDEAIDILTRCTCESGEDAILIFSPTYGMYQVSAKIQGARVLELPLQINGKEWTFDLGSVLNLKNKERKNLKIIYLCSPNNPTGQSLPEDQIRTLATLLPETLIVVDEAYLEFSQRRSCTFLIQEFDNVIVLRTFSKAWGLAGLRFGVLIANNQFINVLQKLSAPYPISAPVIKLLEAELGQGGLARMQNRVELNRVNKLFLLTKLKELPIVLSVYESDANFLLVRFSNAAMVMAILKDSGIIVRSREADLGLESCLRITIGNATEIDKLLTVLWSIR